MKNNHFRGLPLTAMSVSLRPLVAMVKIPAADGPSLTPPRSDAPLITRLKPCHPEAGTTEMTALIAFQYLPLRFNAAPDIPFQGCCDNPRLPHA